MGQAAVAWIRNTAEEPERRPTDIGWLVFAAIGVAVVGVWAQSQSEVDANFFAPLNNLSSVDGVFKAVYTLGSIWALGVVALVLLVFRQVGVAWRTRSPVSSRGEWRSSSTRFFLRTGSRDRRQRADR